MEVEFGFVPRQVVADLQDIGNWKSRATAIDNLQKALRDADDKASVVVGLPKFVGFLMTLVADPNFKIAISSLQILGDLINKVGSDIEPHVRSIIPNLIEKFTDSKIIVRSANIKVLKRLMAVASPKQVLDQLTSGLSHSSWRVREEIVNTVIMALLQHNTQDLGYSGVFRMLTTAMNDTKDKVKNTALEAMAVLNNRAGAAEFQQMLARGAVPDAQQSLIKQRLRNPALPSVNIDGIVEHVADMSSSPGDVLDNVGASTELPSSRRPTGSVGKLPWELPNQSVMPRPRLRGSIEGTSDSGANPITSASGISSPIWASKARSKSPESAPLWSPSVAAGGSGSLASASGMSHLNPSRLSHHSMMYGAPAAMPDTGRADVKASALGLLKRDASPLHGRKDSSPHGGRRDSSPAHSNHLFQNNFRSNMTDTAYEPEPLFGQSKPSSHLIGNTSMYSKDKGSTGASALSSYSSQYQSHSNGPTYSGYDAPDAQAPSGRSGHDSVSSSINLSGLAALKQHRDWTVASSRSGEASVRSHADSNTSDESASPPTPSRAFRSIYQSKLGPAGSPSNGNSSDLDSRYGAPQPPNRYASILSNGSSAANAPAPPTSTHNPGLSLWLQTNLESDHGANRQETFSPSKVELLANLKRRQIEKRANSAQLPARPLGPDSGGYSALNSPSGYGNTDDASSKDYNAYAGEGYSHSHARRNLFAGRGEQPSRLSPAISDPVPASAPRTLEHSSSGGERQGFGAYSGSSYTEDSVHGYARNAAAKTGSVLSNRFGRRAPSPGPMPAEAPLPLQRVGSTGRKNSYPGEATDGIADAKPSAGGRNASPTAGRPAYLRVRSAEVVGNADYKWGGSTPATPSAGTPKGDRTFWDKGGGNKLDELSVNDLTPLPEPERSLRAAIAKLQEANVADRKELDWQGQHEALNDSRRLVRHHPEVLKTVLHEFVRASVPSIDQLRSTTVKNALMLYQEMFQTLGKALDRELDDIVPTLLKKAGEISNAGRENFLAIEADRALADMVRNCSEARTVSALAACANHKSTHVRTRVASHLDSLVEGGGPSNARSALTSNWSCLEKLFKTGAGFLDEGALETRTYGKRIIWGVKQLLGNKSDFDRLATSVSVGLQKKVTEVVESINGPPPPPTRGALGSRLMSRQMSGNSAGGQAQNQNMAAGGILSASPPEISRAGSYSAPVSGSGGANVGARATPERRRLMPSSSNKSRSTAAGDDSASAGAAGAPRGLLRSGSANQQQWSGAAGAAFTPQSQEGLQRALQGLSAKDFRERSEALRQVDALMDCLPAAPETQLIQLLDGLTMRLNDGNSKVNVQALETLSRLFPTLRERISLGLNTLIPALAANLGSTNDKIRSVALQAADQLIASVDPSLLVQNFSHCVANGPLRGKPLLVEKLQSIINAVYAVRPQLVVKYAVPAAFSLANDSKGGAESKSASTALLTTLAKLMGQSLVDQAATMPQVVQQRVSDVVLAVQY
eukprot:CAMPEP_0202916712 /NCGR_PEP_ID=MMETSP1392-20130828/69262_1 /ASSEMBLY_ACC=CAM_ASM_000868 /TAXON_ID=225041 /ORGANISM="Chlamydomonas chlamydogama, Strain SAG 11-48b" /LENGTH=1484 /DNA_ID=CAMNT_0049609237 /DNA_START=160 /DNA_END=4614 /DNA_ORIENTATION=+